MCGIAAIIGLGGNRPERARLEAMTAAIRHRGPDDEGFYQHESVGFGFRRLSILDLTPEGHQPMVSHTGRYVIIFNGEIYNYLEIREELRTRGHCFRSTGDTEVLLASYVEWGAQCLQRLNGMWAFLVHDRTTGRVFGARDRFGVKPLYYHRGADAILFASELKALAPSGLYRPETNWRAAAKFLLEGRLDDTPETFYAGVDQIPAGSCFEVDPKGVMTIRSYWSLPAESAPAPPDAERRFADLFEDAVRLRLRSDVPVGVCLSGGLDSSSIICAMARQRDPSVREPLFAFSFNSAEFDESTYLDATIQQTGATLVPLAPTGAAFADRIAEVLTAQDEPVHALPAFVGYGLMELARRRGVTVVLNGQGADETIAGYPSFFREYWYDLLREGRPGDMMKEIAAYTAVHGGSRRRKALSVLRHAMLLQIAGLGAYRRAVDARRRRRYRKHPWFTPELTEALSPAPAASGTLNATLAESVTRAPLPIYLRVEDRNSMAHSVEARLPFLDYRLVSFLFSLPDEQKLRGPLNKVILREAMRGRIPEVVRSREQKFGFPIPVRQWIADGAFEPLRDLLGSQRARGSGIYRTDRILADLDRMLRGDRGRAEPLISLWQFETWREVLASRS